LKILAGKFKKNLNSQSKEPTVLYQEATREYPQLKQELDAAKQVRDMLKPLLLDWIRSLENPNAADKEYVLDTYRSSCNVVGITCNENQRELENAGHFHFDVVIIDEVSKATPPELILMIMKLS
jgi:superfamily I DNA and/or RNA helicase